MAGGRGCPHTPFPILLIYAVGQDALLVIGLPPILKGE